MHVALGAPGLVLLQPALGLPQPLEGRSGLTGGVGIAAGRRSAHGVGRLLHLPRRFLQIRTVLFSRQPLQSPRRFLGLLRERALLRGAAGAVAAALLERTQPLPRRFLLLPPRQLLQLLEQLVDLAVAALLLRLIGRLVAAGHLLELLLEDLGELLLLRAPAAAATAAGLLLNADLLFVFLFRLLQNLQRLVLGRQRPIRAHGRELAFGLLHRLDRLRQQLRDLLERRIALNELAVQTREQPFDLLAQPRLRQSDDRRALAQLGRRSTCGDRAAR